MTQHRPTRSQTFRSQSGFALVIALLASTVLITLLLALVSTRLSEMRNVAGTVRVTQAQLIAEAGVDYVVGLAIRDNGVMPAESFCSLAGQNAYYCASNIAHAGGSFDAYAVNDGGLLSVTSRAVDADGTARNLEVQFDLASRNRVVKNFAILTCQDLSLTGGLQVTDGDIYSGANLAIQTADSLVNGDAMAYQDVTFTGTGSVTGNIISETGAIINGGGGPRFRAGGYAANPFGLGTLLVHQTGAGLIHDASSYDMPNYCQSPLWNDDLDISQQDFNDYEAAAIAEGSHFGNVALTGGSMGGYDTSKHFIDGSMTITGMPGGEAFDGTYFVNGDLTIQGNYNGVATFVVTGNLTIEGGAVISDTHTNHAFVVDGNVRIAGGSSVDGVIYTNGSVEGEGNSVVNGSVVAAGSGGISGSLEVNYRSPGKLAMLPNMYLEDVEVVRWRNVF